MLTNIHSRSFRVVLGFWMAVAWIVAFGPRAEAHPFSAGYTTLDLAKSQTVMTYAIDELSVMELTGGDVDRNGMLDPNEFEAVKDRFKDVLEKNVTLKIGGKPLPWSDVESIVLDRRGDATQAIVKVVFPPVTDSMPISLTDKLYENAPNTNYVDLLTVHYGSKNSTAALSAKNRTWALMLTGEEYAGLPQEVQPPPDGPNSKSSGSDQGQQPLQRAGTQPSHETSDSRASEPNAVSGWSSFFRLGMNHILTGYDHLLFLLSLLLMRQTFKQYATVITAFTIAHSLTLTLTVLGFVNVSPRIVEPVIALSICYVAADNIANMFRRRNHANRRWVVTFLFGLIHGMGFADLLKEMNLPKSEVAVALFSFNIGIETVQLAIVAVLVPLLAVLHRWKFSRQAVISGSAIALFLGGIWLFQRIFFT